MRSLLTRPIVSARSARVYLPLILLLTAGLLAWRTAQVTVNAASHPTAVKQPRFHPATSREPIGSLPLALAEADLPKAVEIESGQTIGGLLGGYGLPPIEVAAAVNALAEHLDVRRIRAGETGLAFLDKEDRLERLRLDRSDGWVELAREQSGWRSAWHPYERRLETRVVAGRLDGALEAAVRVAGGVPQVAYKMADVLQWDLDFNRDLRRGDLFEAYYEVQYLDGSEAGLGDILAMVYENRGRRLEAYRFDDGYYDAEGRPLRKMFLRSPLPFSRVTSRFSRSRFHPVLKVHRPHYGVDYGAPTGTPVRVTAGGVVMSAARSGGAGRMVKVRHPNGYITAYLHLSGYAQGIRSGSRVTQGDVIGYVGSTGLSTGPHLDYRVQRNGRWIDPLSIQETPAEPVPEERIIAFLAHRDRLRREMTASSRVPQLIADAAADTPRMAGGR